MNRQPWDALEALKAAADDMAARKTLRAAESQDIEIVLSAFGDESHDEQRSRVFAVAGVLGRHEDWDAIETSWRKRTGGKTFHAADCESDSRDYAGIDHRANLKLYADLTTLIASSKLMGHAAVVSLEDYRDAFPSDFSDEPYYWCFSDVVRALGFVAYHWIPQQRVEFTFDRNMEREHNASDLYDFAVHRSASPLRPFFADKISFACRKTVGIQVADLIAREAMKNLDNQIGPMKRLTRRSMKALYATQRFSFVYFRKKDFERAKQKVAEMSIPGATLTEYRQWLSTQKRQDSMTNRIRYVHRSENMADL